MVKKITVLGELFIILAMCSQYIIFYYNINYICRSAFCSLSIVGRTSSTMRITPTPRALSPQDIVRIYVPAAPPEETPSTANVSDERWQNKEMKMNRSRSSSQTSIRMMNGSSKTSPSSVVGVPLGERNRDSNRNSIIFGSGDITPVRSRYEDELIQSFGEASMTSIGNVSNSGQRSTSSSRRGSLSRKSPSGMFDTGLMECSHMAKRRLSNASNGDGRFRSGIGSTENISAMGSASIRPTVSTISIKSNASEGEGSERRKIMTSFEQLAARQRIESDQSGRSDNDGIDKYSPDDEENYSYSYFSADKSLNASANSTSKGKTRYVSESNIQYKTLTSSIGSDLDSKSSKRRPISSANETTSFSFEPLPVAETKTKVVAKEYTRFYSTSVDDDDEEEPKKSSDESSSSPNSKSMLNTPVNETVPLLSSPLTTELKSKGNNPYIEQNHSPNRVPIHPSTNTPRSIVTHASYVIDVQPRKESSHVPLSLYLKSSPVHSPVSEKIATSPPSNTRSPKAITPNQSQPSRIPLLHNSQKMQSPKDLNRVLPPVEIISLDSNRRQKIASPTSPISPLSPIYSVEARHDYDSIRLGGGRKSQQNNGSAGGNVSDVNTIRIKVNQNQRN